jgi:drug/metabolite transporter (DMT)-like permease
MDQKKPIKAWGLLILLSLIWGSSFILIKKGLNGLTPMEVGSLRIFSAALFLLPFALKNLHKIKRHQVKYLISVGLVGSFFPAFLFAIAQTRLESSITGVLNALTPLFTVLIGTFLYQKTQPARVFIGILVGFVGTAVLITAGSGGDISDFNFYALFVVLATIFYAFNVNIIKSHLQDLRSMTITSISLLIVGPLATIQLFFFTDFPNKIMVVEGTVQATLFIIVLGVVGTALALIIFNKLVNITDPVFTSSVTYIIPIVSVVWGVLDGEVLLTSHGIGIAAILVGVYIANRQQSRTLAQKKV